MTKRNLSCVEIEDEFCDFESAFSRFEQKKAKAQADIDHVHDSNVVKLNETFSPAFWNKLVSTNLNKKRAEMLNRLKTTQKAALNEIVNLHESRRCSPEIFGVKERLIENTRLNMYSASLNFFLNGLFKFSKTLKLNQLIAFGALMPDAKKTNLPFENVIDVVLLPLGKMLVVTSQEEDSAQMSVINSSCGSVLCSKQLRLFDERSKFKATDNFIIHRYKTEKVVHFDAYNFDLELFFEKSEQFSGQLVSPDYTMLTHKDSFVTSVLLSRENNDMCIYRILLLGDITKKTIVRPPVHIFYTDIVHFNENRIFFMHVDHRNEKEAWSLAYYKLSELTSNPHFIRLPTNSWRLSVNFDQDSDFYIQHDIKQLFRKIEYKFTDDGKLVDRVRGVGKGSKYALFEPLSERFSDCDYRYNSKRDSYVQVKLQGRHRNKVTIREL